MPAKVDCTHSGSLSELLPLSQKEPWSLLKHDIAPFSMSPPGIGAPAAVVKVASAVSAPSIVAR